jgi:hypothetical protein
VTPRDARWLADRLLSPSSHHPCRHTPTTHIHTPGRSLQQTYDCKAASQIAKVNNACRLLCGCAVSLNRSLKAEEARCLSTCDKCRNDVANCKGNELPASCKEGTNTPEINQCIQTYLKSQGRH